MPKRKEGVTRAAKGTGLTDQRAVFCREYVAHLKPMEAALAAGISAKVAKYRAREWLKRPDVLAEIDRLMKAREQAMEMDANAVAKRLIRISEAAEERLDFGAARAAIVDYGRHIGMWPRGIQWTGNLPPFDQMTEAQLEHLAKGGDPAQLPRT